MRNLWSIGGFRCRVCEATCENFVGEIPDNMLVLWFLLAYEFCNILFCFLFCYFIYGKLIINKDESSESSEKKPSPFIYQYSNNMKKKNNFAQGLEVFSFHSIEHYRTTSIKNKYNKRIFTSGFGLGFGVSLAEPFCDGVPMAEEGFFFVESVTIIACAACDAASVTSPGRERAESWRNEPGGGGICGGGYCSSVNE